MPSVRLWASISSITLDVQLPHLGKDTDVAFGLSIASINRYKRDTKRQWPYQLSPLGEAALVQIPHLERSFTAVTGRLEKDGPDFVFWKISSIVPLAVHGAREKSLQRSLEDVLDGQESAACEAMGSLSVSGREIPGSIRHLVPARIHRFQSLCLRAGDPRFGEWFDVFRYQDLGSDPDVIAASVCLAEVELT